MRRKKTFRPAAIADADEFLGGEGLLPELSEPQLDAFVRRLVAAKLADCLDALSGASAVEPTADEEKDLIEWVSDDSEDPWSLRWCLDVVGLSVDRFRATLKRLRRERMEDALVAGQGELFGGAQRSGEPPPWVESWRAVTGGSPP